MKSPPVENTELILLPSYILRLMKCCMHMRNRKNKICSKRRNQEFFVSTVRSFPSIPPWNWYCGPAGAKRPESLCDIQSIDSVQFQCRLEYSPTKRWKHVRTLEHLSSLYFITYEAVNNLVYVLFQIFKLNYRFN